MGRKRWKLGLRGTLLLLCIGSLSTYFLLAVGGTHLFFPWRYRQRAEQRLTRAYMQLCTSGVAEGKTNPNVMLDIEEDNLTVLIFREDDRRVLYYSWAEDRLLGGLVRERAKEIEAGLDGRAESWFTAEHENDKRLTSGAAVAHDALLYLGGRIGQYLVHISTPMEPIEETTIACHQFMLWIGLIVLGVTAGLTALVAQRITYPVEEMTRAAEKIANLDFSQSCDENAYGELGRMAHSINVMSQQMQHSFEKLRQANGQLQADIDEKVRQTAARKELIANLSHDLKTPVGLVAGYAEGLAAGMARTPEQVREYCDIILDETARMDTLISHMLQLSRLESGIVPMNPELLDMGEMAGVFLDHFALWAEKEHVTILRDWQEGQYAMADAFAVEQVLINYIQNALSHIGGARRIELRIRTRDGRVRVEVFNTSDPIPEEELARVWDSFYRRDKARPRRGSESGLGLAVVRSAMEQIGMPYGAENAADGVVFWFELPEAKG